MSHPHDPAGQPVYEGSFPARPDSPRLARAAAADRCRAWCLPELRDDAVLIVSELVTNAVVHAGTEVRVRLERLPDDAVRLEVADDSTRPLRPRRVTMARTGRGLALVDVLATRYGVEGRPNGKVVWAELTTRTG